MTQEKLQRQRLQSMVDSHCVGCPITRKSVSSAATRVFGWLFKFNVAGQACHAQSAGEGEYYVLTVGAADNLQVRQLLKEFGVNVEGDLFSDTSAARAVANRQGLPERMRRIEVRYLHVQQLLKRKVSKLSTVKTDVNTADIGTKHLQNPQFNTHKVSLWRMSPQEFENLNRQQGFYVQV